MSAETLKLTDLPYIITVDVIYMQKKLGILFKFLQALLTPF